MPGLAFFVSVTFWKATAPVFITGENSDNPETMKLIDAQIMQETTATVLTMKCMLAQEGLKRSYERMQLLMRKAAIMPIYRSKTLTKRGEDEYIYPYLLRNMTIITRMSQFTCKTYVEFLKIENISISMNSNGRCTDNTYIKCNSGARSNTSFSISIQLSLA